MASIRYRLAPAAACITVKAILAALTWIGLSVVGPATLAASVAPDTVLFNGKIFTSAPDRPYVQALAIQGDRIEAVGDSKRIKQLAGPRTRLIDLNRRTVIPGLNDAHNHMHISPHGTVELQLRGPNPSWPEMQQAIAQVVLKVPRGSILSATIGGTIFLDPEIDRSTLDKVSPDNPVILTTFTGHGAILNTAALLKVGILENQPNPLGARYERSADGRLNGVLREYATVELARKLGNLTSDADAIVELRDTLADAAKHGITTLQVMSEKMTPARYVDLLEKVPASIRMRIMRMPGTTLNGRNIEEGRAVPRNPAPLITVSGTKWLLDGVPFEGTFAPRQRPRDSLVDVNKPFFGGLQMTFPVKELDAILRETLQSGDQLLLHVSGYPASKAMLDAMQAAGGKAVWAARRVRFEHGDGLLPSLIPRVKEMGIVVVEQGAHLDMSPFGPEFMPRIRAEKSQPLRSLLAAGIPVALSSDDDGASNPFLQIMLAATHPNRPSEAITREQAVIAYTLTSAYAEFAEKDKGSLEPGKLADLAVLSQDIFAVPLNELPTTVAVMTMVGGRVIYDTHHLTSRKSMTSKFGLQ